MTLILKFDNNWNFMTYTLISSAKALLVLDFNNTHDTVIYITAINGIYKYSSNLTQLAFYFNSTHDYGKLIYSSTTDHLLVTSGSEIDVFDRYITFIKSISISYTATGIEEYNNQFFVTTSSSYVYVLVNEVVISSFSTLCGSINGLAIDSNGLLALLCSNKIYVYNSNGQYMNISWASLVPYPVDLGFDADGNFLIISTNGVFLLNTEATIIQSNVTIDSCTLKSNFLI